MSSLTIKKSTLLYGVVLFFFCLIFVFLFVAYPFGDDILQYLYHIRQMQKTSNVEDFFNYTNGYDILFFVILKIFSYLNDEHLYLGCFAIYFIIFLFSIGKIYLQSMYKILIFMIVILFSRLYMDFLFNAIRTEFSALALLVSFYFIVNNRYTNAGFFLIISGMLHFQMTLFFIGILGASKIYSFAMTTRLNLFFLTFSTLGVLSKEVSSYIFSLVSNILNLFYSKTIYYSDLENTPISLTLIGLFLIYLFLPTILLIGKINNKFFLSFIVISNVFFFALYGAFPVVLRLISVLYPLLIVGMVLNATTMKIRAYLAFLGLLSIFTIIYIPFKDIDYTLEPSQEVLIKLEGTR